MTLKRGGVSPGWILGDFTTEIAGLAIGLSGSCIKIIPKHIWPRRLLLDGLPVFEESDVSRHLFWRVIREAIATCSLIVA